MEVLYVLLYVTVATMFSLYRLEQQQIQCLFFQNSLANCHYVLAGMCTRANIVAIFLLHGFSMVLFILLFLYSQPCVLDLCLVLHLLRFMFLYSLPLLSDNISKFLIFIKLIIAFDSMIWMLFQNYSANFYQKIFNNQGFPPD